MRCKACNKLTYDDYCDSCNYIINLAEQMTSTPDMLVEADHLNEHFSGRSVEHEKLDEETYESRLRELSNYWRGTVL